MSKGIVGLREETHSLGRYACYGLFAFIVILQIGMRYSGNSHGFYTDLYQYILSPGTYQNDPYIQHSFVFQSSTLYTAVKTLHVNLDNDYVGLIVHLCFSLLAVSAFLGMAKRLDVSIDTPTLLLVAILLIYNNTYRLINASFSGLIGNNSNTPSYFAQELSFVFLWLLSRKSVGLAAFLLTLILSLTPKTYWILFPIGILFIWFSDEIPKAQLVYFLLPLAYVIRRATIPLSSAMEGSSYQEKLYLCRTILERDGQEDAFHLHPMVNLLSYAISFCLYPGMMAHFKGFARALLKSVFYCSLATCVIGGLYTWKLFTVIPIPTIILLSPVRSMAFYTFFFYFMFWIIIFKSEMQPLLKMALAVAFIKLCTFRRADTLGLSAIWLLMAWVYYDPSARQTAERVNAWLTSWLQRRLPRINQFLRRNLNLILFLSFAFASVGGFAQVAAGYIRGGTYLNVWTYPNRYDLPLVDLLLRVRNDPQDYPFMAIIPYAPFDFYADVFGTRRNSPQLAYLIKLNFVARKSKFLGDKAHFYFNREENEKHATRAMKVDQFIDGLTHGAAEPSLIQYFHDQHVHFLLPAAYATHFSSYHIQDGNKSFVVIEPNP